MTSTRPEPLSGLGAGAEVSLPLRIGVVDLGSNAVRTMIAEVDQIGGWRMIEARREALRLGADVFLSGSVPGPKLDALVEVLARFRERCVEHDVYHSSVIATSAVRDARNQDEILARVAAEAGLTIRVISGSEEAYLLTAAVRSKVDLRSGRSILVDLGGGSVEVSVVENGEIVHSDSYRLGALRVLHALESSSSDPQAKSFVALVDEYVGALESRISDHLGIETFDRYVATGGNIETIADLLAREGKTTTVDGIDVCRLDDVRELATRLGVATFEERCHEFGLRPDRADTILPAAIVYYRIGRVARSTTVLVPRVGIRDGLLQEIVAETVRHSRVSEHRDTLLSTCRAFGRRYHTDAAHAEAVRRHAIALFDATEALHRLGVEDRTLLEAAALLHDVGAFVSTNAHHKHSWYLIRESDIPGIDRHQRELVALVARYHRRSQPSRRHAAFAELSASDRERVRRLAALLRLADGLDRSHRNKIESLTLSLDERCLRIRPRLFAGSAESLALERLGFAEKAELFATVFERQVVLEDAGDP